MGTLTAAVCRRAINSGAYAGVCTLRPGCLIN